MNNIQIDFNKVPVEVFFKDKDLVPHKDALGNISYYKTDCPACGEHEAYIYTADSARGTPNVLRCSRLNNCAYTITGFDYYKERLGLASNKEALDLLCKEMGLDVDKADIVMEKVEATARYAVLDLLAEYFRNELCNNPDAKEYLDCFCNERKYDPTLIKKTDLGYYPGYDKTVTFLKSKNIDHTVLERIGLRNPVFGRDYHLFIPYRNIYGSVTGFLSRYHTVVPPKEVCDRLERKDARWYSTTGLTKESLYNLHRFKKAELLIIVEGYLDALYLSELGLPVVAAGQGSLSQSHVQYLSATGVKKIVICFDREPQADDRAETAIRMLLTQIGVDVFKCSLSDAKDPDEFYRKHGLEALKAEFDNSEHSSLWLSKRVLGKYDTSKDLDKSKALDDLIELSNSLNDRVSIDNIYTLAEDTMSISREAFADRVSKLREHKKQEKQIASYKDIYENLGKLIKENNPTKIGSFLRTVPKKIVQDNLMRDEMEDVQPFDVDVLINDMRSMPECVDTGVKELDSKISIYPGTVTIIAGRPRMGKSSVAMNFLYNMLEKDQDAPMIFFSLEMSLAQIFGRLNTIIANNYHYEEVMEFYKTGNIPPPIQDIRNLFKTKYSGRLYLISEPNMEVDKLINVIYSIYRKHGKIGTVILDYLQLVKASNKDANRYLQVGEVCKKLVQATNDLNIPVIALAALNRDVDKQGFNSKSATSEDLKPKIHHLGESGQIEADAALIIGLHDTSSHNYTEHGDKPDETVKLELIVLKNRFGESNSVIEVRFNKKTGRLLGKENMVINTSSSIYDDMQF